MVQASLARRCPTEDGAVAGRTVYVIQYDRLEVDADVLQYLERQHPVVPRQPELRQRQVQKPYLESTSNARSQKE